MAKEEFLAWSQKAPEKYDERDAERVWEDAGKDGSVTLGTLIYLAEKYSSPAQTPETSLPEPQDMDEMALQCADFIETIFQPGEAFELVLGTKTIDGRSVPDRSGKGCCLVRESAENTAENLEKIKQMILENNAEGALISTNPVRQMPEGKTPKDSDVTDFRYTLIESDEISREEQLKWLPRLNIPVRIGTWSGNKSLHLLVKIDAGPDCALYKNRVGKLHAYLNKLGFPMDSNTKNASRLTRLPGFYRGEKKQYIMFREFGPKNWNAFEALFLAESEKKKDQRERTSPVNGQKGGRPSIDVTRYAEEFLLSYKKDEVFTTMFLNGNWWLYEDHRWQELPATDMVVMVTRFLQNSQARDTGRISNSVIRDTIANLQGLCGRSSLRFKMPCWLPDGGSAHNVVSFTNGLLDIPKLIDDPETPLQAHTPRCFGKDFVTYAYDPAATCPKWMKFIETTFD